MHDNAPSHRQTGFTLMELLVVITILVMLTVVGGTVALNYLGRAKSETARLQINQISTGLDLYKLDLGAYPSEAEALAALVSAPAGTTRWQGPYVKDSQVIVDPWDRPFVYRLPADGQPQVVSLGADGAPGGEGSAADISN